MSKRKQERELEAYMDTLGATADMLKNILLQYISKQINRDEVKIPYKILEDLEMLDDTDDPDMCESYGQLILSCSKDVDYEHGWKNVRDSFIGYSIRPNCLAFYINPKANWDNFIKDFEKDKEDNKYGEEFTQFLNSLKTVEELEKENKEEKQNWKHSQKEK